MASSIFQLTMRSGPTPGKVFPLDQEEVFVGRDVTNDIAISDPEVSRRHARLMMKEGRIFVEDLGSTNGTFLNGERISSPEQLRLGDAIILGEKIVMVFEKASQELESTAVSPTPALDDQPGYQQDTPAPDSFPPPPEPPGYQQPSSPEPRPVAGRPPRRTKGLEDKKQKKGGLPTWMIVLIVAIIVLVCVISVTLWFMPASWWCAITFDMLAGCPVP